MKRYHKKIYFPEKDIAGILSLINNLNKEKWQYTKHSIDKIYSLANISDILNYIKYLTLDFNDLFEYYTEDDSICKLVFRFNYNDNQDIIFVVSDKKNIITIYLNDRGDKHCTLNKNIYDCY